MQPMINNKRKPFDDPRVRRAMHLALDRPALIEVVKDVAPMMVGGFLYPFSELAAPQQERDKWLGYQADPAAAIKEARALMAAAGQSDGIKGLDFMVREIAIFKLWSQAIQAMLKESLNIECNLRTVVEFGMVRRRRERQLRLGDRGPRVGAARPLRLLQRLVRQRRAAELFALGQPGIPGPVGPNRPGNRRREASGSDPPRRSGHGQDPPLLPVGWERIHELWYNSVKGRHAHEASASTIRCGTTRSGSTKVELSADRRCGLAKG